MQLCQQQWLIIASNPLLKSINTPPAKPLLSMDKFHFSSMDIRAVCIMYLFLYSDKWGDNACLYTLKSASA